MSFLRTTLRSLPRQPTATMGLRAFSTTPIRPDVSRVHLIGRIGTEPEVGQTSTGNPMTKYTLAVNVGGPDNRTTQWFRVIAFGEGAADRLSKGSKIFLEGDLRLNTYEGEDGKKHTSVTVIQRSTSVILRPLNQQGEGGEASEAQS